MTRHNSKVNSSLLNGEYTVKYSKPGLNSHSGILNKQIYYLLVTQKYDPKHSSRIKHPISAP